MYFYRFIVIHYNIILLITTSLSCVFNICIKVVVFMILQKQACVRDLHHAEISR